MIKLFIARLLEPIKHLLMKPWFQILLFVFISNIVHISLMMAGVEIDSEKFIYASISVSFWFGMFLLVIPFESATTGRKLLTLTCSVGAIYCLILTIATVWAGTYLAAWYVFSWMRENFYITMQLLTAMEIISIFANTAIRLGRIGEAIDGFIDHVYSAVFARAHSLFANKRL